MKVKRAKSVEAATCSALDLTLSKFAPVFGAPQGPQKSLSDEWHVETAKAESIKAKAEGVKANFDAASAQMVFTAQRISHEAPCPTRIREGEAGRS